MNVLLKQLLALISKCKLKKKIKMSYVSSPKF